MRHSSIRVLMAAAALSAALAACGHGDPAPDCGDLSIQDAWVTPAHAGSREMLGYFTLHNDGSDPVRINGVSSDAFDRALFQNKAAAANSSNDANGGAQPLGSFTVAAGKDLRFSPGDREVALYSPTRAYHDGDRIQIRLTCGSKKATLAAAAVVRDHHDALPASDDDDNAADRKQVIQDGRSGGGAGATDDSKTAN